MLKWYEQNTNNHDVVISTRIRLARNLKNYPFGNMLLQDKAVELTQEVKKGFLNQSESVNHFFEFYNINDLQNVDKIALVERHVISPLIVKKEAATGLILSKDESLSIMVNEEDHLRIQSIVQGMNIKKALEEANRLDDLLESYLQYAFDEKYGYLTACPTNVGTGLRSSYMIHVPALETTGKLQIILDAIGKFGITVRGIYGEGTQGEGSVFQISNQITLGQSEEEIIDNLNSITNQIVEQERKVRENLFKEKKHQLEDKIYRSYGILKNARILTSKEAMSFLSDLKIGVEMGIIKFKSEEYFNIYELMMSIQPANLQKNSSKEMVVEDRDVERATFIRNNLPKIK
ncbi:protein arginine kinase [Natranaerovirga pectinivora]|uniref:Protein-arginine kinase n=1 Tax=Natranaerovirga pectinivora TaxID=682400 RepID=A0A4R3MKN4_9FIRM|nr:protein arginine kinase [Natranaerovirga pectinivora]TCT14263.1 protein arginine kinase [Natranaerovirga pectinivora]